MADIFHAMPPAASTVAIWFHYRRLASTWFPNFLLNQDSLVPTLCGVLWMAIGGHFVGKSLFGRRPRMAMRCSVDSGPKVRPLPEMVPKGVPGELYRIFRPYLVVEGGCAPLPVVDEEGSTGCGFAPPDEESSDYFSDKEGQVYVRSGWHRHQFAIMYAWYFHSISHCHEWQAAVVWVRGPNHDRPTIRGVALTKSGEWVKTSTPHLDGTHVLVEHCNNDPLRDGDGDRFLEYQSNPLLGHGLTTTPVSGTSHPIAAWECVPQATRDALQNIDFGLARVPIIDGIFEKMIEEAFF
ncbi:necrosis inducing protein-domain-containing protein [Phyllosticta citribraziliensis]|uniref:Necrosis inducing protein-domain-containing protein n=1 Tax=Phyllosticta citribraziliensis TaxID=989973 RepID=A0ABR1M866_9PEZI